MLFCLCLTCPLCSLSRIFNLKLVQWQLDQQIVVREFHSRVGHHVPQKIAFVQCIVDELFWSMTTEVTTAISCQVLPPHCATIGPFWGDFHTCARPICEVT